MPLFPKLRVIIESEPHTGQWNMAVDEALLETAISAEVATLRWYQWNEPTISLGYFQKYADLSQDTVLSPLPRVRRLSGGGAILHDDEVTYCLTLPASQLLFRQPHELYRIVHSALIAGLGQLGFPAMARGTTVKRPDEPLLCFQRQDEHDLIVAGKKILGSAQRRRRGAIMQHGSLICRASRLTKDLPGLVDLCELEIPENLVPTLAECVAKTIADSWSIGSLTQTEIETATRIRLKQESVLGG
jgi:lipoyl(octanoyl) transferase